MQLPKCNVIVTFVLLKLFSTTLYTKFFGIGPTQKTRYKMVSMEGEAGKKFSCPPNQFIASCR